MERRDFLGSSLAIAAGFALPGATLAQSAKEFPNVPGLTKYVSDFIVNTKYEDIPQDVLELGRKSIPDGFGLALAGSVSEMGPLVKRYIRTLGSGDTKASIIGGPMQVPVRFAALANGILSMPTTTTTRSCRSLPTGSTAC